MTIDLDDIEAKARRATPGRWTWIPDPAPLDDGRREPVLAANGDPEWSARIIYPETYLGTPVLCVSEEDRQHIAALSPGVVLELVRRLRAAEACGCGHAPDDHLRVCSRCGCGQSGPE